MHTRRTTLISAALLALVTVALPVRAQTTLLNVSYDVSRELYKDTPSPRTGRPSRARR